MKRYNFKINVTKINKSKLFKGENGTYLNGTLILNDEQKGEGFIVEQQTKDERDKKERGNILGNFKLIEIKENNNTQEQKQPEDDLPF